MKALYRKYRPISLDQVIGQDAIVTSLKTAIKSGKVSHAYMFVGPRGCGKTSVARIFAHEINKFSYQLEDSYVDIIEIDAASNTGVDNIRDLREKAVIAPTAGKYKVYIIDEVHMLSKSAFNALLKLLEEPPEHVVFIMATTDPEKVPITITSRTQVYTFRLADPDTMSSHLKSIADQEKINIENDAISIIVRRGGGSFRDSISLLDQISTLKDGEITADDITSALGLPRDKITTDLLSAFSSNNTTKITEILKDFLNSGAKPETLVDELIKKILAAPSPDLLPLLNELPSVQPPFSEAKLLIAFLGHELQPKPKSRPSANPQSIKKATAPVIGDDSQPINHPFQQGLGEPKSGPSANFPPARAATYIPDGPDGLASAEAVPPASQRMRSQTESGLTEGPDSASLEFDWNQFLSEIEPENINLFKYLSLSKPKISGSTLHIYASKKIEARIMNSQNNKSFLSSHAKGLILEFHGPDELKEDAKNDPQIDQISDIMGNVQEVKTNGTPF